MELSGSFKTPETKQRRAKNQNKMGKALLLGVNKLLVYHFIQAELDCTIHVQPL